MTTYWSSEVWLEADTVPSQCPCSLSLLLHPTAGRNVQHIQHLLKIQNGSTLYLQLQSLSHLKSQDQQWNKSDIYLYFLKKNKNYAGFFFPQEAQKLNKIHFKEFSKFSLIAKERQKKLKTLTSILLSLYKVNKMMKPEQQGWHESFLSEVHS